MHRAVNKAGTVLALFLQSLQEVIDIGLALVTRWAWHQAAGPVVAEYFGCWVGVDLAKANGARHVHDVAHRHVAPRAASEFRHVLGHQRIGVNLALVRQLRCHQSGEGLGDREQQMRRPGLHLVVVALVNDTSLVQHHDGITVTGLEPFVDRGLVALVVVEHKTADRLVVHRQHSDRRTAVADIARWHEFTQVLRGKAHLRVFVRVTQVNALRIGWREGAHQAELVE